MSVKHVSDEELGSAAYKAFVHSEAYARILATVMGKVPYPPPWKGLNQMEMQAWISVAKAVAVVLEPEQEANAHPTHGLRFDEEEDEPEQGE